MTPEGGRRETVEFEVADGVATITLARPDVLNALNRQMCLEMRECWSVIAADEDTHAVVVRAKGRGFCSGLDLREGTRPVGNFWHDEDPGAFIGPKANHCFKPVVAAVNGVVAGGGCYHINEADIILASPAASILDPHVDIGLTSIVEPLGLRFRLPLGEVLRLGLMGKSARLTADRAYELGLFNELVEPERLWERAQEVATVIASKPPTAVQGHVRALWNGLDQGRSSALATAYQLVRASNASSLREAGKHAASPKAGA